MKFAKYWDLNKLCLSIISKRTIIYIILLLYCIIIFALTVQNTVILGKPVEAQMLRFGEKNPFMQLIQWSPLQFKVFSCE